MCAGSPACCFKSFTRSAFDVLSAGPRLKSIVAKRQKRNVTARTAASGFIFNTIEKFIEVKSVLSEARRRLNLQFSRAAACIGRLQAGETLRKHRQSRLRGSDR